MFDKPWLITLGPLSIPTKGREELMAMAFGVEPEAYIRAVWKKRVEVYPAKSRARSKAWPATSFDRAQKGYILKVKDTNITELAPRRATVGAKSR